MYKKNLICLLVVIIIIGCKKDQKPTYLAHETEPVSSKNPPVSEIKQPNLAQQAIGSNVSSAMPGNTTQVIQQNVPVQQVQTMPNITKTTGEKVTINPRQNYPVNSAHGTVGHRCDIPIGAPMFLPVQKNKNHGKDLDMAKIINSMNPINTTSMKIKTPPGMNPPHGEKNHRCDIPVGASLKLPIKNMQPQPVQVLPQTNTTNNKMELPKTQEIKPIENSSLPPTIVAPK